MPRILVAEDEAVNREMVAAALEAAGHDVVRAEDGAIARDALLRESFDLLVTDLQMPVLTGLDLLALVRAQPNPIPVIIVSGTWTREEKHRARTLGAAALFEKGSLDLRELVREVERLMRP